MERIRLRVGAASVKSIGARERELAVKAARHASKPRWQQKRPVAVDGELRGPQFVLMVQQNHGTVRRWVEAQIPKWKRGGAGVHGQARTAATIADFMVEDFTWTVCLTQSFELLVRRLLRLQLIGQGSLAWESSDSIETDIIGGSHYDGEDGDMELAKAAAAESKKAKDAQPKKKDGSKAGRGNGGTRGGAAGGYGGGGRGGGGGGAQGGGEKKPSKKGSGKGAGSGASASNAGGTAGTGR